jgi:hypothetical protein
LSGHYLVVRPRMWHFLDMVRIRTLFSSVMALALLSSSAYAEGAVATKSVPKVQVRGSDKADYSRIVFDWGKVPKYTVQQTATTLVVKFATDGKFVNEGASPEKLSKVSGYKVLSPNAVEIDFSAGQNIRHFIANNRLIVDVIGNNAVPDKNKKTLDKKPAKATEKPVEKNVKVADKKSDDKKPIDLKPVENKNIIIDKVANADATVAEKKPEEVKIPPVLITVSSTNAVGLAAFQRNGYLWVVEDRDGVKVAPQISGGDPAQKAMEFERVPAKAISAFRMKIPNDVKPVATGGGLVWKISLEHDGGNSKKALPLKRLLGAENNQAGPSLLWPARSIRRINDIDDPDVGDVIKVAFVEDAPDFAGPQKHYVDFDILPSAIGLAILSKTDDLEMDKAADGVLISRPEGLSISTEKDVIGSGKLSTPEPIQTKDNQEINRIYDFSNWQIGQPKNLSDNQRLIISGLGPLTDTKRAENLIGLARLMLSFYYAPEAMGYLDWAQQLVPDMDSNPEFLALRGAAEALSWKPKEAYQDFSSAGLNDITEIPYWKAYTLAKLDDWQQAAKILPNDVSLIATYPLEIRRPFGLTLLEVALREGNLDKSKKILDMLEPDRKDMPLPYASAFDYLSGEYARQTGKSDEAEKLWKELSVGPDDLYRARARFALTMLQLANKKITPDKAIDNLEGLRYAWRGDDLEVSINYNLAKTYLDNGEPIKALSMMKFAHDLSPLSEQGKNINADLHQVFKDLFTPDKIKKLSPVDALTVYNEFADLIPSGAEGEAIARQLAERLADADLLPRATEMLGKQVDGSLKGLEGARVAIRLAALQTMDGKADDALKSLDKAEAFLKGLPAEDVLPKQHDIGLLRAKDFSLKGKPDEAFAALALLPQDEDTLRLRADIAWQGKRWQDAADSLEQLVQKQNISLTRPLTDEQADLILNWGVALYLADNRYVLANLRERYGDAMAATNKAQKFEVVTRPRQAALLTDRDTINTIIDEAVIFKDFLKSFEAGDPPPSAPAPTAIPPTDENGVQSQPATNVPAPLRNVPGLKTDEVLGD